MLCSRCHRTVDSGVNRCTCTEAELADWRNERMGEVDDRDKPKYQPGSGQHYCGIHDRYFKGKRCPDCQHEAGVPGEDVPNYGAEAIREHDSDEPVRSIADGGYDVQVVPPPAPAARQLAPAGTGANARQPGGDHYQKREYQHWDFVVDTGMHYLLGCATKYVSRWRQKGGVLDLEKAAHYLDKAAECDVYPPIGTVEQTNLFVEQLEPSERAIIIAIMQGNYEAASMSIQWLARAAE